MFVKQISVFLENAPGRLLAITKELGDAGIDLISLNIADTTQFGILRAITSDTDLSVKLLRDAGFTVTLTDVLAVTVPDVPGGLTRVLEVLAQNAIAIEYLYSFVRNAKNNALLVFRVEELQRAYDALHAAGYETLSQDDVRRLGA